MPVLSDVDGLRPLRTRLCLIPAIERLSRRPPSALRTVDDLAPRGNPEGGPPQTAEGVRGDWQRASVDALAQLPQLRGVRGRFHAQASLGNPRFLHYIS